MGNGTRGRRGARGGREAGPLRPQGNRLDLGRHRIDQPRPEGRGALLQGQGQAPGDGQNRAQGDARHHARSRARGLRSHLSGRRARWPARPGETQGGIARRHDPGLGDVRQQRDRCDSGHSGDRRALPWPRHYLSCGRGPGDRQAAGGSRAAEGGLDVVLGPQDLRAERCRRALRAAQAAGAHRSADARRRARARDALGHAGDPPDRRHGRSISSRPAGDGDRQRAHTHASRQAAGRPVRDRGAVHQRRHGAPRSAQPQRQLQLCRRREPDHGDQGHRCLVGIGVHVGVARAFIRSARTGPQ